MWISQCIHLWASSEIHLVPKIFTWYCFLNAAGGTCIPSPIWTLAVSIFSSIHNWYFYCRKNRQYRKIGNSKNENSVFFHQRHAFSTSFNIFVVTYRVTNFLPKLVDMLLFSMEKTEFPFLVFPYFRVMPEKHALNPPVSFTHGNNPWGKILHCTLPRSLVVKVSDGYWRVRLPHT